jgi:hypothetical protein
MKVAFIQRSTLKAAGFNSPGREIARRLLVFSLFAVVPGFMSWIRSAGFFQKRLQRRGDQGRSCHRLPFLFAAVSASLIANGQWITASSTLPVS